MAIAIARQGGIGIVHKNLTAREQAREVAKVKRFESGVVRDPITIPPDMKIRDVIALSQQHGISGFPPEEERSTLDCLRVLFNEEWAHHRFAARDLDVLDPPLDPAQS